MACVRIVLLLLQVVLQLQTAPHDAAHNVVTKCPKNLAGKIFVRHEPGDEVVRRLQQQHIVVVLQRRAHARLSQLIIPAISQRLPHHLPAPYSGCNRRRRRRIASVRREAVTTLRAHENASERISPRRDHGTLERGMC